MAAILLGGIGSALGAGFGGTILGLSGAVIGGGIGSLIGTAIDSRIIASLAPDQRQEGARLDELRVTSCELSAGCPFGADQGDWSYHTSNLQEHPE